MINPYRVAELYGECLLNDADDPVDVEGIVHPCRFSAAKLQEHKAEIARMLDQLQDPFKPLDEGGGGGWSFLNVCQDRDGNLWTGVHWTCEMLIQLGIGTGQASWLGSRELWPAFPGGLPYVSVNPVAKEPR